MAFIQQSPPEEKPSETEKEEPLYSNILENYNIFKKKIEREAMIAKRKSRMVEEEKPKVIKNEQPKSKETIKTENKREEFEIEQKIETHNFVISYYNPELGEEIVFPEEVSLHMDESTMSVEESLGEKNSFQIYSYLASPFINSEYNVEIVEKQIGQESLDLEEREFEKELKKIYGLLESKIGSETGSEEKNIQEKISERFASQIVEDNKNELTKDELAEKINANILIAEIEHRKETLLKKINEEILAIDSAIELLKKGKKEEALEKLPSLTKERFLFALKNKLPDSKIINMLLYDKLFLSSINLRLKKITKKGIYLLSKILTLLKK